MSNAWLAAESFERGQRLIQALNALAISVKLALAGVYDPERKMETEQAREELRTFLDHFAGWLAEAEHPPTHIVAGIDPRMHQLVTAFASQRRRFPRRSLLYRLSIEHVRALLDARTAEELRQLLACLQELRAILEDHLHADTVGLLGEGI
jgi:hypothetical protein